MQQQAGNTVIQVRGWQVHSARPTAIEDSCLIVPTYRRPQDVMSLLNTLVSQEYNRPGSVPATVAIVDGSSEDDVEEAVTAVARQSLPFHLRYIRSPRGLTRQRNVGIDATSEEFVFFLDDDAIPDVGYFQAVLEVFENDKPGDIGAVGGCVLNDLNQAPSWTWRLRLALRLAPLTEPMQYTHCGTSTPRALMKPFSGIRRVDVLSGCAFSFRRGVLECERFSQFFEGYSQGEDMEMSLRVGQRWVVVCAGDARVMHIPSPAGRPASFQKGRMDVRNRLFIWRRYSQQRACLVDRLRLGGDFVFLLALDLLKFLARPWRFASLRHAAGILYALIESVTEPKYYDESVHRTHYQIEYSTSSN